MHKFLLFIKELYIPKKQELKDAYASFSKKQLCIFISILTISLFSILLILITINNKYTVEVPTNGGTITEGIIGIPTLINPVLALSDADKDLTSIIYSGLMRKNLDGTFIPDLAESYTISPDGLNYTFIIKKDAKFHDGINVTADDIIFTINKIKDPLIKSPRMGWDVVNIKKQDDQTVIFTLNKPYISFMDNTTIGILPMHIWKNVTTTEFSLSPLNLKAIGSGPYKIQSFSKNKDGIPEKYTLKYFDKFTLGAPRIKYLNIISYANEKDLIKAMTSHTVDQAGGISPENASLVKENGYTVNTATLPRIFGIFFNKNKNKIFEDKNIIKAFNYAIDKQSIVDKILYGYGTIINSPIPETILSNNSNQINTSIDEANKILDDAGWRKDVDGIRVQSNTKTITQTKKVGKKTVTTKTQINTGPSTKLSFSLTTGNTPELKNTANLIKEQLEKIGAQVDIKIYETGQLNQLIRARDYEFLLFGQDIKHESDLFSFWHSSQKTDPGYNIALYSNTKVDNILESTQKITNYNERIIKYKDFIDEFNKDIPAILIYSPKYLYATSKELGDISIKTLIIPSDRFAPMYKWYANTDHVWKIFTNTPTNIGTDK
jgi:peptide/nickel transport system substrate-binding protein